MPDDASVLMVPEKLFNSLSPVDTPTGMAAICERPEVGEAADQLRVHLLLDGIQNPGNLGSILRTAAATRVTRVLLSPTCTDAWSPKCLRGGMGAQFVLPISVVPDPVAVLSRFQGKRIATSPHQGRVLMESDLSGAVLVAFGGEGAGLAENVISSSDLTVRIPLAEGIESLNVGAAVAMICYERLRQGHKQ